jgi:hypothetical protein
MSEVPRHLPPESGDQWALAPETPEWTACRPGFGIEITDLHRRAITANCETITDASAHGLVSND